MRRLALLAIFTMLSTPVYADKEKDKGYADRADNHGQVVADCSHRANQRNLKGQDRKADTDGVGKYGEPRGRDVLGKGSQK